MTIGPSNSGKSSFVNSILIPQLNTLEVRHKYLTSDGLRRELIGENLHKHDKKMQQASKQAFDLLHFELDIYTQYPINTDVVIVDATNLSKIARSKIMEIAEKNAYNVIALIFDYRDQEDYFKYVDASIDKRTIVNHVRTLRKETLRELDKSKFKHIQRIDSIDSFSEYRFTFSQTNAGFKVLHENVCIVGDVHGCYEEFLEMLVDNKGIVLEDDGTGIPVMRAVPEAVDNGSYVHHILIGDLVDKGPQVENLIRFVDKNRDFFIIVEGNHERWNYQYLTKVIKPSEDNQKLIDSYFDSVKLFESNEELKNMFLKLYDSMYTFVYNDRFIVTHAPCQNKYLGKSDKKSLKAMNTIMYPKEKDFDNQETYMTAREEFFKFLIKDGDVNYPKHFFGHVMLKDYFANKNKYGIDTGCVVGNTLTTATMFGTNFKPYIRRYKSKQEKTKELIPLFRTKQNEVNFGSLDPIIKRRLNWCAKNGVNFISGTMSPVDKQIEFKDIEALPKGIEYFVNKGIRRLILQPKFMGSRCNVYLHKTDIEKCKAISRNAFEIKPERLNAKKHLNELFAELQVKYADLFTECNADTILFDGELLPWNSMGKDLIERDFMLAYKACNYEHQILNEFGFEDTLAELDTKFDMEDENLKKHELTMKRTYNEFKPDILHIDLMQEVLDKYKHQLDLFGSDGELEFKPFAILKTYHVDGSEKNWISSDVSNIEMFSKLSDSPYCVIDFDNDNASFVYNEDGTKRYLNFDYPLDAIIYFWDFITGQKEMEGLVLKPEMAYVPNVAPYMKCRNKEYLRLTYGYDYDVLPVKVDRLIENKSISRKLSTSIKEYELARQLLNVKRSDISVDNQEWLSLVIQLINEQEGEKTLDPRL